MKQNHSFNQVIRVFASFSSQSALLLSMMFKLLIPPNKSSIVFIHSIFFIKKIQVKLNLPNQRQKIPLYMLLEPHLGILSFRIRKFYNFLESQKSMNDRIIFILFVTLLYLFFCQLQSLSYNEFGNLSQFFGLFQIRIHYIELQMEFLKKIDIKQKDTMAQRRTWSSQEDEALKILKDQRKVKKWSKISQLLESQFGIIGRNGKQCRERYHNHLDNNILKEEWTEEENEKLIGLHNELGNSWASIARSLNGRTDNCVKNHFYSQFRKAIRIINDLMKKNGIKFFKPIKTSFIKNLIAAIQGQNRKDEHISDQFQKVSRDLKEQMLRYSLAEFEDGNEESLQRILELMEQFQKHEKAYHLHADNKKDETHHQQHKQDIFYAEEAHHSLEIIENKDEEIFEEQSQGHSAFTPQTFNPQQLSLKGISSFLDRHLDNEQKNLDLSFLSLIDEQAQKEKSSQIDKESEEEGIQFQI